MREIAASMKLSEGAVKYHLHAGRGALRVAATGTRRRSRRDERRPVLDVRIRSTTSSGGASRAARPWAPIPTSCSTPCGRSSPARTRRRASFASAIAGVAVIVVVLAFVLGAAAAAARCACRRRPKGRCAPRRPHPRPRGSVGSATTPDTLPDDHGNDATRRAPPRAMPDATAATEAPATAPPRPARGPDYSSPGGRSSCTSAVARSPWRRALRRRLHHRGPRQRSDPGRSAVQQRRDRVAHPGRRRERSSRPRDHAALTKPRGPVRRVPPDPSPRRSPMEPEASTPPAPTPAADPSPPAASGPRRRRRRGDGPRALRVSNAATGGGGSPSTVSAASRRQRPAARRRRSSTRRGREAAGRRGPLRACPSRRPRPRPQRPSDDAHDAGAGDRAPRARTR